MLAKIRANSLTIIVILGLFFLWNIVVILLRKLAGIEKITAFYLATLILAIAGYVAFQWIIHQPFFHLTLTNNTEDTL